MPTGRISKRSVDALNCPKEKDRIILWDDDLAGFGVAAFPSGSKVYIVQFRKDGRSRRTQVGRHGRFTPEEARSEAKKLLGQIEAGADPIAAKKAARDVPSFRKVAEDFLAMHSSVKRKARTHAEYERLLEKRILPQIGSIRITELNRAKLARLHAVISIEAPISANRAVALISAIWSWASRREIVSISENPVRGIERNREQAKERYLTSEEFARLGEALRHAETVGLPWDVRDENIRSKHLAIQEKRIAVVDPFAVAAIRLLIFTGARLGEILSLQWSHIDIERGIVFLPDSKTGRKSIYLSSAALEILSSIPRIDGNKYVIVGSKQGKHRIDIKRPWEAIRRMANLNDLRIHDLRHSFASVGVGGSLGLPIVGKLLGHSQPKTTARYAHLDADPLKRAANKIGKHVQAKLSGKQSKKAN